MSNVSDKPLLQHRALFCCWSGHSCLIQRFLITSKKVPEMEKMKNVCTHTDRHTAYIDTDILHTYKIYLKVSSSNLGFMLKQQQNFCFEDTSWNFLHMCPFLATTVGFWWSICLMWMERNQHCLITKLLSLFIFVRTALLRFLDKTLPLKRGDLRRLWVDGC